MKNKKQVTVLVSVPVTLTFDSKRLTEDEIREEIVSQIKGTLEDQVEWFAEQDDPDLVIINELSVMVNDIMPTNYKYNNERWPSGN
jgi:hypothetical protein